MFMVIFMKFLDSFHNFYCINLDRRPDRRARVEPRFERLGISPVIRYAAFDAQLSGVPDTWGDVPGAYGCLMSHLAIVREARSSAAPHVVIFEDDVVFDEHFHERFDRAAADIPADWDMLLLGGSHWSPPERISGEVFRATATVATHAYALKHTIFGAFIELNGESTSPVDCNNTVLQGRFHAYCFLPNLAWQEDGYSDIAEDFLNFSKTDDPRP
jgi:glycosyl transferase, family 25